jgi:hypothetical protein
VPWVMRESSRSAQRRFDPRPAARRMRNAAR